MFCAIVGFPSERDQMTQLETEVKVVFPTPFLVKNVQSEPQKSKCRAPGHLNFPLLGLDSVSHVAFSKPG